MSLIKERIETIISNLDYDQLNDIEIFIRWMAAATVQEKAELRENLDKDCFDVWAFIDQMKENINGAVLQV